MLVGRDPETSTIARLAAGARLGEAGVLVLLGEPGVGKTAVLDHAVSHLVDGFRLLRATGIETERDIAFAGLSQLLGPALGGLDSIPQPQAAALGSALSLRAGPPTDRFAVGAATLSLVSVHAETGPVAVVVDDAQLLDRPSLDALAFAARRLHADPVLILVAARTSELGDSLPGLPTRLLEGLDEGAARELVEQAAGTRVGSDLFAALYRRTAGNPLALRELGADPGGLEPGIPGLPDTVPAVVTGAFARRLQLLDETARRTLLVAVVAGGELATVKDACRLLDLDVSRLAAAEDAGLVTVDRGRVDFRHPLLRSATYSGASARDRHATHRAVADVLPAGDVDRRAWHLAAATWGPDAEVAALLEQAGDGAFGRSGYAVAATAYHRAATLSPNRNDRCRRLLRAAEAAWTAGEPDRVTSVLDEMEGLDPAPDVAIGAVELRAAVAARTGLLREARDMLMAAADSEADPDRAVVLLADAVHAAFYLGDTATSITLADRLSELTAATTGSRARALGLMATGMSRVLTGRGGTEEIRAAVPLLESSEELRSDPRRLPWLMLAPLFLRERGESGARLRKQVEEVRGAGGVGTLPALLFHIARDQATSEGWDRALANFGEAIRLARETGQSTELAASLAARSSLASRQGDEGRCREDAEEALRICEGRGLHLAEAWALLGLGDLELSLGDTRAAAVRLRALEDLLARHGMADPDLSPCPELVDVLLRQGARADAEALVPPFLATADDKGQPWARARARRAAGSIADEAEMDAVFEEALDLHRQTLDLFEAARTRLVYGERLRRAGRRIDARVQLHDALQTFDHLGARLWSQQAAAELFATGETVQRVDVGWRTALTSQELQVGLLLAEGRTTREAAAALFLSPKTVEYHLRKVYTKLGIHSRDELAVALAELPDDPGD